MAGESGAFEIPGRRRRAVLSLAPLIDVTFILLIFFMLVTQFERFAPVEVTLASEQALPLTPPQQQSGQASLQLEILADGRLRLSGNEIPGTSGLSAALTKTAEDSAGRVAIRPEPDVPLQLLLDVLAAIQSIPAYEAHIVVPETQDTQAQ